MSVGYGAVLPNEGSSAPSGVAIFGLHENGVLISEAGVAASPPIRSGRIYADINGPTNTGVALANPGDGPVDVSFFFTDSNGNNIRNGLTTIPAKAKISAFLNEPPFKGDSSFRGTFTFNSSVPIAAVALRGLVNERSEFLMTTLPVIDLPTSDPIIFPQFADGGGWTTQLSLINPGDTILTGTVRFLSPQGAPATLTVNGQTGTSVAYSIPARTSQRWQTAGTTDSIAVGSIRVIPANSSPAPSGVATFSFRNNGITVTEAGVPSSPAASTFRLYAETLGEPPGLGSIQTGFAVANVSSPRRQLRSNSTTWMDLSRDLPQAFRFRRMDKSLNS